MAKISSLPLQIYPLYG